MAVLTNTMMQGTAADSGEESYKIERSIRFDHVNDGYLTATPHGKGNQRIWTWAAWVKRPAEDGSAILFSRSTDANTRMVLSFYNGALYFYSSISGAVITVHTTGNDSELRDPSAWYHLVFTFDTTEAEATERTRMYVNGKRMEGALISYSNSPARNLETPIGSGDSHWIGADNGSPTEHINAYMADVHFINGRALAPAAFGFFDSSRCWQPKAFALPTPNDGTTWSSGLAADSGSDTLTNATFAFNGDTAGGIGGIFGGWTWTVPSGGKIENVYSLRFLSFSADTTGTVKFNGKVIDTAQNFGASINRWYDVPTKFLAASNYEVTSLSWNRQPGAGSNNNDYLYAIEVNGVLLVDGRTDVETLKNPNDGRKWSSIGTASGTPYNSGADHTHAFDGSVSTQFFAATGPNSATFTLSTPISGYETLEMNISGPHGGLTTGFKINGVDKTSWVIAERGASQGGWLDLGQELSGGALNSFEVYSTAGNTYTAVQGIRVDGHILVDSSVDNSFHLKFNDTSSNAATGRNTFNDIGATNVGALPIYNTTNAFTLAKGSGYRTDPQAANLVFAMPGDVLTDEHDEIKGSGSAKTVTNDGVAVSTVTSKLYGSSLRIEGTDMLSCASSADFNLNGGDWCVEGWFYSINDTGAQQILIENGTTGTQGWSITRGTNRRIYVYMATTESMGNNDTTLTPDNEWYHIALVRNGSNTILYINGVEARRETHDAADAVEGLWIGERSNSSLGFNGFMQDIRIYKGHKKYSGGFIPVRASDFTPINIDAIPTTVAAATKGLPIYNTSGDQGGTKGSGYRTDPHKANLVLAIPGDVLTDVSNHADLRNSGSAKGTDANGNCAVSTDQSRFYGSSIAFDGTSDYLEVGNSSDYDFDGDFTVEAWIYVNAYTNDYASVFGFSHDGDQHGWNILMRTDGKPHMNVDMNYTDVADATIPLNKWTHIALVRNGSGSGNVKFYTNGRAGSTTLTETDATGTPSSTECMIGSYPGYETTREFNGYIQDVRIYKGVAKYTDNFDADLPLTFSDSGIDSLTDSPTNYGSDGGAGGQVRGNYCTWNTLDWQNTSKIQLSNGNLTTYRTDSGWYSGRGTFGMTSGKWYFECTGGTNFSAALNYNVGQIGIAKEGITGELGVTAGCYMYYNHSGNKMTGDSGGTNAAYGSTWSDGDVIGVAFDADNGKIWWSKNGTWAASGNPAAGSNEAFSGLTDGPYFPAVSQYSSVSPSYLHTNFGQRPFKYTAPSGFKALCTQNLPDTFSGDELNNPSKYFDILRYTGTGDSDNAITGLAFTPDFVWIKNRSHQHNYHELFDQVRGAAKSLFANTQGAITDYSGGDNSLRSFDSGGFTVNDDSQGAYGVNGAPGSLYSGDAQFVAFNWDAGTAAGTVKSGATGQTITASNSWYSQTAGFEVLQYSGTGSAGKIGHNLNAPPAFIIIKQTTSHSSTGNGDGNWIVGHDGIGAGSGRLILNDNHANETSSAAAHWNSTTPTNELFGLGTSGNVNGSGSTYSAWLWTPIPGYSSFGKYTGNSAADGPFNYCGFRPRWIIIKKIDNTDSNSGWHIYDTARDTPANPANKFLAVENGYYENRAANNTADVATYLVDFYSNGFKLRHSSNNLNNTGHNYIYCAFAEHPFKTARAR